MLPPDFSPKDKWTKLQIHAVLFLLYCLLFVIFCGVTELPKTEKVGQGCPITALN